MTSTLSPGLIGGINKDTKIFTSKGVLVPAEKIEIGTLVLSADGSYSKVTAIHTANEEVVAIKQASCHTAHLRDQQRAPPWGLIEMRCSERQRVHLKTKQRIKKITKSSNSCTVIEITQLRDHLTEDGRCVKILVTTSKQFAVNCLPATIQEFIDSVKVDGGFITWQCEVGDIKYLNKELRASTKLILCPLALEVSVLLPWLESEFGRNVTSKELEAMAWLLGFWIGDGHRRGAKFALHSGDRDVNNYLEMASNLWGMTLRIVLRGPDDGYKADGYLHTYDGSMRHWNRHNPLVKVLEGLRFYENGRLNGTKAIPCFMRTEQRLVREAFMAGLIDSDGSVNIQDHCIRVKIPTAYPLIRNGILFIGRSLGLNVSIHFCHARENPRGYHESDTWVFHLFGGSNHGTLWSVLSRCSCERKRNPPIQFIRKADFEEFEADDEDFIENDDDASDESEKSDEDSLSEQGEGEKISDAKLPPRKSVEKIRQSILLTEIKYEDGNEDHIIAEDGNDDDFNLAVIPFKISKIGKEQIFAIELSSDSNNKTIVTEQQIISCNVQQVTEYNKSNPEFVRTCFSCHGKTTLQWYKLPWEAFSAQRLCTVCYERYSRSKMRCCKCCKVYSLSVMQRRGRREKKKACTLDDGSIIQGYLCDVCDGIIKQFEENKTKPQRGDEYRVGVCYSCNTQESSSWRRVPWANDKEWCGTCRSRYGATATICTNKKCRKIPFKGEFEKMEIIDDILGRYKCLGCGSIAKKDMKKKCRHATKMEERRGTCYSCGLTTSKRWSKLPWNKKAAAEICHTCYLLLRAYKGRCLNPDCRRIFRKVEVTKMKNLEPIEGPSSGGPKCRPCIKCHGHTTVF